MDLSSLSLMPRRPRKLLCQSRVALTSTSTMIRELAHVVASEKAKLGVFISLAEPTAPMNTEALKSGYYESPHHGKFPKMQIFTIEELFAGKRPQIPFIDPSMFKAAPAEDTSKQGQLF